MKITVGFFSILFYTALIGTGGYLLGQGRIKADLSKPGTIAVTWEKEDGTTQTEILDEAEVQAAVEDHPEGARKATELVNDYRVKLRQIQQLQDELADVVQIIKGDEDTES